MRRQFKSAATTITDSLASSALDEVRVKSSLPALRKLAAGALALASISVHAAVQTCNEAGLDAAIAAGGTNTFSCGSPTTITVSATKGITGTGLVLDGGGLLTISGGNTRRIFLVNGGASATFQNLTIRNGFVTGGNGAGILNFGTAAIVNSTFSQNNIVDGGGSALQNVGAMTVDRSTFLNNTVTSVSSVADGAAINNNGTSLTVSNSTFSGNSAGRGGAILASTGLSIYNSTIVGNTGTVTCGAGAVFAVGTTTLFNTIVANNTSGGACRNNCNGSVTAGADSISDNADCGAVTQETIAQINLAAMTGSPAYFPLNPGSAAIDAGNNAICAAPPVNNASQNGVARPIDGNGDGTAVCDVGSFEAQQVPIAAVPVPVPTLAIWVTMLLAFVLGGAAFSQLSRISKRRD